MLMGYVRADFSFSGSPSSYTLPNDRLTVHDYEATVYWLGREAEATAGGHLILATNTYMLGLLSSISIVLTDVGSDEQRESTDVKLQFSRLSPDLRGTGSMAVVVPKMC